jgi:hypothetical protein
VFRLFFKGWRFKPLWELLYLKERLKQTLAYLKKKIGIHIFVLTWHHLSTFTCQYQLDDLDIPTDIGMFLRRKSVHIDNELTGHFIKLT